jgi:hypothetical protein
MEQITFDPMLVVTNDGTSDGRLVKADGAVVAVLAYVAEDGAEGAEGWFLEAGFGPCSMLFSNVPGLFPSLEAAANDRAP